MFDAEVHALDLVLADHTGRRADQESASELADAARAKVDEARLQLAELAGPAVYLLALRLAGIENDNAGRAVTEDREKTALSVLDRCGMPKLRAHQIAASVVASSASPVAGHPGWTPTSGEGGVGVGADGEPGELDPSSVDAQIDSFMAGVRAAADLKRDRGD